MPVAWFIPEIVQLTMLGSSVGGSIAGWCQDNDSPCCVKRSIMGGEVPVMAVSDEQVTGACGVPQYNFDLCQDQLQGLTVTTSIPQEGRRFLQIQIIKSALMVTAALLEGKFENVPSACMVLATVLTSSCDGDGPRPTPCGSDCLLYTGLSDADYAQLSKALSA
ncbi:hypothetical protein GGR53DRAFT_476508 [Hypoxylon sp. FL1150]|nr:hypothetical protein GGR53DRAFT_476508 [Hypoxylon sp. FL1150]